MDEKPDIEKILFLDIETIPQFPVYEDMPERLQKLWEKKARTLRNVNADLTPAEVYPRAGIYAEFGQIVCISVGFVKRTTEGETLRITSYAGDDEKTLLVDFANLLHKAFNNVNLHKMCGHNAREFDFPYIARRMLIHGLELPDLLDLSGKKPWQVPHLDTMDMWKFGDYKNYTSLDLLAAIFDIPTPKDDIDGSQIYEVYYQEKNLGRIVEYCQKDVVTVVQVYRKIQGMPLIEDDLIKMV